MKKGKQESSFFYYRGENTGVLLENVYLLHIIHNI